MAKVAKRHIKHGTEDNKTVRFAPGEEVRGISADLGKRWEEAGLIGDSEEEEEEEEETEPQEQE